jgi:hypothetical protein
VTAWTEERRKKQSELLKRLKRWEKSTGPKSRKGKAISAMNAYKNGAYSRPQRYARHVLKHNREFVKGCRLYARMQSIQNEHFGKPANELLKSFEKSAF